MARVFQGKFHQCHCAEKLCAQDLSSGVRTLGDGTCIASLAKMQGATRKMRSCWHGFFRTNFINTIVSKNCAPKICQSFQTLVHGTGIAPLAGSETKIKEQSCWHGLFRTNSINAIVPKNWCQRLLKRDLNAGQRDMRGKKFFAGVVFILHGVLSVNAWFSLPSQRSKLKENPSIGYASA